MGVLLDSSIIPPGVRGVAARSATAGPAMMAATGSIEIRTEIKTNLLAQRSGRLHVPVRIFVICAIPDHSGAMRHVC
jgi:hypothetical protein